MNIEHLSHSPSFDKKQGGLVIRPWIKLFPAENSARKESQGLYDGVIRV